MGKGKGKNKSKQAQKPISEIIPTPKIEAPVTAVKDLDTELSSGNDALDTGYLKKLKLLTELEERLNKRESDLDELRKLFEQERASLSIKNSEIEDNTIKLENRLLEIQQREDECLNIEASLESREIELKNKVSEYSLSFKNLEQIKKELEQRTDKLGKSEAELTERESNLIEREKNAELGFIEQKKSVLQDYYNNLNESSSSIRNLFNEFVLNSEQSYTFAATKLTELEDKWKTNIEDLISRQRNLEKELITQHKDYISDLTTEKKKLLSEKIQLKVEQELLEDDKFIELEEQKLKFEQELNYKNDLINLLNDKVNALEEQLRIRNTEEFRGGVLDKIELKKKISFLEAELDKYQIMTKTLLPIGEQKELERLRKLNKELEELLIEKDTEIEMLSSDLLKIRKTYLEKSALKEENETLKVLKNSLEVSVNKLRNELDSLNNRNTESLIFPSCSEIDKSFIYPIKSNNKQKSFNSKNIVPTLRKMIFDLYADSGKQLNYSAMDIRAFLSGMAMSKIIILEGISGTGKSSLPIALSQVIGTECDKIEVQAGWRDKHDLMGYYNSFEKKYYESSFFISLYKAQSDKFKQSPFMILLDEMNLSHPEYYFAEFLSELEKNDLSSRKVKLLPKNHLTPCYPNKLSSNEEGLFLPIPSNVWFIGTANNDETTMGFADKTYDRAFILELPEKHPNDLPADVNNLFDSISYADLMKIFSQAKSNWKNEAKEIKDIFKEEIQKRFMEYFKISWGNRLDEAILNYSSANLELGGNKSEITDYLLAFKLLHKLLNRKDLDLDKVSEFELSIMEIREIFDLDGNFEKTSKYLEIIKENCFK